MALWGFSLGRGNRSRVVLRLQARRPRLGQTGLRTRLRSSFSGCIEIGPRGPSASPFAGDIAFARRPTPRPIAPTSPGFESPRSTRSIKEKTSDERRRLFSSEEPDDQAATCLREYPGIAFAKPCGARQNRCRLAAWIEPIPYRSAQGASANGRSKPSSSP